MVSWSRGAACALAVFWAACGQARAEARHAPRLRLPAPAASPSPAARLPRIAVIGGGISGLTALHELSKRGLEASVYEAADRPGGRILTLPVPEAGLRFEAGAELVNSEDAELQGLLAEIGVGLVRRNPDGAKQVYLSEGKAYEQAEFLARLFDNSMPQLKILERDIALVEQAYERGFDQETLRRFDRLSISGYLRRIGATPMLKAFVNAAISPEYGADYKGITTLALLDSLSIDTARRTFQLYPGKDEAFLVQGGAQRIIEALVSRHRESLRLSHRLISMTSSDARTFQLAFKTPEGTKVVEADYVYMTLPLPSLRRVSVRMPGFSGTLRRSIGRVRYGSNAKLALYFTRRLWRELGFSGDGLSNQGYSFWDSSEGQPGPAGSLTFYMDGHGLREAGAKDLARRVLAAIESAFPGISRVYMGRRFQRWPYSYPGADLPGQRTSLSIPYQPIGNFFWAGDFFSARGSQSYMNGAVEAALRAARALAAHIVQ